MGRRTEYDAVVVGAGPNGLTAAITLARAGLSVIIFEAHERVGGGIRSAELTLPGFLHDICSAIHPLAISSPALKNLQLGKFGLDWIHPPVPLAHPLDDGTAILLESSIEQTAENLGRDAESYTRFMAPLSRSWNKLVPQILGPLRIGRNPILQARFGFYAVRSSVNLAQKLFRGARARSLWSGLAAHSMLPLDKSPTAAFAMVLALSAHNDGWPMARGGSGQIALALEKCLLSLKGKVVTGLYVKSLDELPPARVTLFDLTPRQILGIGGSIFPAHYRRALESFRYGVGVFKIDWALDGPIPFRAPECARAGTVHIGGTSEEIAASEKEVAAGICPQRPYIILAQQSLFDSSRAPAGKHTAWAYCHLPAGSEIDMTERIENQIERFAPGFRDTIIARHVMGPADLEKYNGNYIGGSIDGGAQDWRQLFTRPTFSLTPYRTPVQGVYICSSSTPPGGGTHGMCGFHAARTALADVFHIAIDQNP